MQFMPDYKKNLVIIRQRLQLAALGIVGAVIRNSRGSYGNFLAVTPSLVIFTGLISPLASNSIWSIHATR